MKKKTKNPVVIDKETEKRRRKLFGKMYDDFTEGKTEKEIEDRELQCIDPDKWLKKAEKERRVLID